MCGDEPEHENFDEMLRSVAREISRSAERMTQFDVDEIADAIGVDPTRARDWVDGAGRWLRAQAEGLGQEFTAGVRSAPVRTEDDPLRHAGPHPLDMPTDDQGLALAALDSGRWTVEPGSSALASHGEGPGPSDALGLVRELHARDWITADGGVTLVGHRALARWLEATNR